MPATSPSPGQVLGHFRLQQRIGEGGMGIIFRARDLRLERDVAIKILNQKMLGDPAGRKRFRREALVLGRLNHPNVELVYEFTEDGAIDYIVMEYVPGASLNERLDQGALPEGEVVELGMQLARGLAAAHSRGILHRDLKPGNACAAARCRNWRVTVDHLKGRSGATATSTFSSRVLRSAALVRAAGSYPIRSKKTNGGCGRRATSERGSFTSRGSETPIPAKPDLYIAPR
jgi:protein kinase-like protein